MLRPHLISGPAILMTLSRKPTYDTMAIPFDLLGYGSPAIRKREVHYALVKLCLASSYLSPSTIDHRYSNRWYIPRVYNIDIWTLETGEVSFLLDLLISSRKTGRDIASGICGPAFTTRLLQVKRYNICFGIALGYILRNPPLYPSCRSLTSDESSNTSIEA